MSVSVLLVEPEQLVADMIRVNLENAGYELIWVQEGAQALSQMDERSFDLILVGVDLSLEAELELVKKIRQHHSDLPLMALTSGGDVHKRVLTLEKGADDYLSKPFEMTELMARIKTLLKHHVNT